MSHSVAWIPIRLSACFSSERPMNYLSGNHPLRHAYSPPPAPIPGPVALARSAEQTGLRSLRASPSPPTPPVSSRHLPVGEHSLVAVQACLAALASEDARMPIAARLPSLRFVQSTPGLCAISHVFSLSVKSGIDDRRPETPAAKIETLPAVLLPPSTSKVSRTKSLPGRWRSNGQSIILPPAPS